MRKIVASPHAPKAIGPYSQAVLTHHVPGTQQLHAAGQIPIDPATGELVAGDAGVQAERVLENIAAVLAHAGMGFADIVKTTVFLIDLGDFAAMNQAYERRFAGEPPPLSTLWHKYGDVSGAGPFSQMGEGQDDGDHMDRRSPPL